MLKYTFFELPNSFNKLSVTNKLKEYSERYGIEVIIDMKPLGVK